MFDSKKGEALDLLMHPAFVIFIAVLLLVYLLWFIHGIGSDLEYEKKFLAADLALTIDSLLASQDNVVLYYLPQADDFVNVTYSFEKNKVSVFESPSERNAGVYYFTSDPSVSFAPVSLKPRSPFVLPRFSKIGNKLVVADGHDASSKVNIYALSCPGQRYNYGSVTFDPGHGFDEKIGSGDRGFISGSVQEHIITKDIGSIVRVLDTGNHISSFTRDSDIDLPVDARINAVGDSVVSLHIGSVSGSDVFVKAYVNYESSKLDESLKLACELVNKVSSVLVNAGVMVSGVAVVPVVSSHEKDSQLMILVKDRPAVLLEVGNINLPMFSQENKKLIAAGIIEGVDYAME